MQTIALHIAADHPAFAGHFPGMPITPGVVLLDLALTAITSHLQREPAGCRLNNVKFLRPVMPDTELTLQYETSDSGNIRFDILDAGHVAVSGAFHA
ncbi:hypothetical protein GCM10007205_15680 [Oxalicibacterium flavum]|uniref:ApeI dehydratase-like domain-containing protein n=1 Tax=Oxalicibacterium flavum TaxID=179467 RepID=A0A8J2ULL2_9BURK|nr:MaoC/PaaZ C-terminal domain-containing protein [Oxalicibacterium flavum]GGC07395.1 hypothetical protein GCM10007205_15680 [Oxalicibacterium flavum]